MEISRNISCLSTTNGADVLHNMLTEMFTHQIILKMFHFKTGSYAAHKASDAYLGKFAVNFDRFMEVAQGIKEFGGDNRKVSTQTININNIPVFSSADHLIDYMEHFINAVLVQNILIKKSSKQTGILAIRDEMIADAQQLVYLLKFK